MRKIRSKHAKTQAAQKSLIDLVGNYQNFEGWDKVRNRLLLHPEEVHMKSPSGWYPIQHAFYHHPDYQRDPVPEDVAKMFTKLDSSSARCALLEACRNPDTLTNTFEILLRGADLDYMNRNGERDFHQLSKNKCSHRLQELYVTISIEKGVGWKQCLRPMWIVQRQNISTLDEIILVAIRTRRKWNDGLEDMFLYSFGNLQLESKRRILEEAVCSRWSCPEGFNYILKESSDLMQDDRAKKCLLSLGLRIEQSVSSIFSFQHLLVCSLGILEEQENFHLLKSLFQHAIRSDHEHSLTALFLLLQQFPQLLHDASVYDELDSVQESC